MQTRRRTEYLKGRLADRRVLALPANQEQDLDQREEPSPGPALAPTFDSDDNSHLYRAFETRPGEPGWLTRYSPRSPNQPDPKLDPTGHWMVLLIPFRAASVLAQGFLFTLCTVHFWELHLLKQRFREGWSTLQNSGV